MWQKIRFLPLSGTSPRSSQSVHCHYTDWAIPADEIQDWKMNDDTAMVSLTSSGRVTCSEVEPWVFFSITLLLRSWTATYTTTLLNRNVVLCFQCMLINPRFCWDRTSSPYNVTNWTVLKKIAARISFHFRHKHKVEETTTIQSVQRLGREMNNRANVVTFSRVKGLFLLKASRKALGPTIQWVPPSLGVNRPDVRLMTDIHPLPRLWISVPISPLLNTPSWRAQRQLFLSDKMEFCLTFRNLASHI